jgi:hypothetical protein
MDSETQKKGIELQEVLRLFKKATTYPLSACILETPKHKSSSQLPTDDKEEAVFDNHRKSPRLSGKNSKGKSVIKLAQDLVAKKCGIIQEEDTLDDMTLQEYLHMYKKPLTKDSMEAIIQLTEVAQEKKKKKSKDKKDKGKIKAMELGKEKKKVKKDKIGEMAHVGVSTLAGPPPRYDVIAFCHVACS